MPVERHEQEQDLIRQLRARLDECEAERARTAAAAERERAADRAELRMLRARIADISAALAAQQVAAAEIRAEGWRAGFHEGHAAGQADEASPPPGPADPGERHLRIVSFAALAAAWRVLRSKMVLAPVAATALVVAAIPAMHSAEFRGSVSSAAPSITARAYAPQGGGGVLFPLSRPSPSPSGATVTASPEATASPAVPATGIPSPADPGSPTPPASPDPSPTGTGTASADPPGSPTPTDTDSPTGSPSPAGTDTTPAPAPSACPAPSSPEPSPTGT
jgi:hypothetical protein